MERIYFPGSNASIVWKNFVGVKLQGWRSIWRGKMRIFYGALNAHRTYRTISDDNDGDDTGGGTIPLAAQGGGYERPLSSFTAGQFTYCTQDEDNDVPTSPRILVSEANALVDSSGPSSQWIDDVSVPSPYTYHISDIYSQQPTRWIYECVDPEVYNMC
jgi:hypothetical protein